MQTSPVILVSELVAGHDEAPSRLSAAWFQVRVAGHRMVRAIADFFAGPARSERVDGREFSFVAGESRTPLWPDRRAAEAGLQRGKVRNLRVAVEALDGTLLRPEGVFSFWAQIGRASKSRGFVHGRMLQQGCMIPAVGGGLCQLSNALYDVALQTGCEIVERHAHSRVVPGSSAEAGRDATVAWNYVDLRFRAPQAVVIRARVTEEQLVVSFCAEPGTPLAARSPKISAIRALNLPVAVSSLKMAQSCGTCSRTDCFRKEN
jgi:vancomycin resistance protein YoaR